jgi:hypothetical protein
MSDAFDEYDRQEEEALTRIRDIIRPTMSDDAYDEYDRQEDEALTRLRDIASMSDEETDTEDCIKVRMTSEKQHITLTVPSAKTEEDQSENVVMWMLNLMEQTLEHEAGRDPEHEDSTTCWRRIKLPEEIVFKFVMDGEMSCCVVTFADGEEMVLKEKEEFSRFVQFVSLA